MQVWMGLPAEHGVWVRRAGGGPVGGWAGGMWLEASCPCKSVAVPQEDQDVVGGV